MAEAINFGSQRWLELLPNYKLCSFETKGCNQNRSTLNVLKNIAGLYLENKIEPTEEEMPEYIEKNGGLTETIEEEIGDYIETSAEEKNDEYFEEREVIGLKLADRIEEENVRNIFSIF